MSVPRSSMRSWNIWSICGGAARWARSALRGVVNARKPEEHRKNRGPPDPSDADTVSDRLPRRNLGERPYLLANHGRVLGYGLRLPAGGGDHRGRTSGGRWIYRLLRRPPDQGIVACLAAYDREQIGSASCRERVCQYV